MTETGEKLSTLKQETDTQLAALSQQAGADVDAKLATIVEETDRKLASKDANLAATRQQLLEELTRQLEATERKLMDAAAAAGEAEGKVSDSALLQLR